MIENIKQLVENSAGDSREISGYIVRFDAPYFDGTTRTAAMYEKGLATFKEQGINIPLQCYHTSVGGKPCGVMTSYEVDESGIKATFRLDNSAYVNNDVKPSIENGTLTHFSTEETSGDNKVILSVALVPIGNAITARIENEINQPEEVETQENKSNLFLFY